MTAAGTATQPSTLLPLLFERLAINRRLTILDLGPGVADTVDFFSQFRCRVHFVDLYSAPVVSNLQSDASEAEQVAQFNEALDLPPATQVDICLFWDFINYIDGPGLRALVKALGPYMYDGTRCHGFGMLNAKTVIDNNQFGIRKLNLLSYRRRGDSQLPVYVHSQRELNEQLGHFQIYKSVLMSNSRLEFILRYDAEQSEQEKKASIWNF